MLAASEPASARIAYAADYTPWRSLVSRSFSCADEMD